MSEKPTYRAPGPGIIPVWEDSPNITLPQPGYKTVPVYWNEKDEKPSALGKVPGEWPVTSLVWINGKLHPKELEERVWLSGKLIETAESIVSKVPEVENKVIDIPSEELQKAFSIAIATLGFVRRHIPRSGQVYWLFKQEDSTWWATFATNSQGHHLGISEGRRHAQSITALSILQLEAEDVELLISDAEEGAKALGLVGEIDGLREEFGRLGAQAVFKEHRKVLCSK